MASGGYTPYNMETMAIIARLAGEGIGPFKNFDFDFSDAAGNPHPGPHIFAGINGSGKSTILRTLAWMLELSSSDGFQWQEWQHLIQGYSYTRAMIVIVSPSLGPFAFAQTTDVNAGWEERMYRWVTPLLKSGKIESLKGTMPIRFKSVQSLGSKRKPINDDGQIRWNLLLRDSVASLAKTQGERPPQGYLRVGGPEEEKIRWKNRVLPAGYGPSRLLKHLPEVNLSARIDGFRDQALSFESTVQNEAIQSWLLGLFSKRAIAKERGESLSKYSAALGRFENALRLMCAQDVSFSVDIEPSLQPRLLMYNRRLDFSQLPDGVRSTVGWLADFLMRADMHDWQPIEERSAVLLLDEVDAHLHPRWQRTILPSLNRALPEVQVFATSHSPFVIASCPGARIHVLELDADGRASNKLPEDAPIGESILATMKDIFGVDSRFDVETEKQLDEWNQLRRSQAAGKLPSKETQRLETLTHDLSSRSEELRQLVSPAVSISDSWVASLQSSVEVGSKRPAKAKAAKVGK